MIQLWKRLFFKRFYCKPFYLRRKMLNCRKMMSRTHNKVFYNLIKIRYVYIIYINWIYETVANVDLLLKHLTLLTTRFFSTNLSMQLPEWLISWIASYLSQRQQRVVIDRKPTELKSVEAVVVQCSVLGPILFLLFIMDTNDVLPPSTLLHYRRLN